MIKQIQKDTEEAVVSMKKGREEVENGMILADKADASLKEIISGADKVVDIITQVAASSEEQSTTSELINNSIEGISNISKQTSEGIHQIAKATEGLNNLTSDLEKLVINFNVGKAGNHKESMSNLSIRANGKLVPKY